MPKIPYINHKFSAKTLAVIEWAERICTEYARQGYDLTLRQLYYQAVSQALIPNSQREYKNLGEIVNHARLAGLIDWNHIVDRTRNLRSLAHWESPEEIVGAVAQQYRIDKWADQPCRVECWIEKDALVGVIQRVCDQNDVPYFSCRGYTSQSELWAAAMRLKGYADRGQEPVVLHLGDHDPSGKDMTRDIGARMELFMGGVEVRRLALNIDQVRRYAPPPNPAKLTDSRAYGYIEEFGPESWELDALRPQVIVELVQNAVDSVRDDAAWQRSVDHENQERRLLRATSDRWDEVAEWMGQDG